MSNMTPWFVLDSDDEDDEAEDEKSGGYEGNEQVSSRVQKWRLRVSRIKTANRG